VTVALVYMLFVFSSLQYVNELFAGI